MSDVATFRRRLLLIALILGFFFSRLHNLDALPIFLDEAAHLHWARLAWDFQPFHAASDGKLLTIIWSALFWPFAASVWLLRASGLLLIAPGFAALLAFARREYGLPVAVAAAVAYSALPFALFFERMALPDGVSAAAALFVIWSSTQLLSTPRPRALILATAIGITAMVSSKLPNLVLLPIPLIAFLVYSRRDRIKAQLTGIATSYLIAAGILTPLYIVLRVLARSDLGFDLIAAKSGSLLQIDAATGAVAGLVWNYFVILFGTLPLYFTLLASVLAFKHHWRPITLILATIVPAIALLVLRTEIGFIEARFFAPFVPLLLLIASAGLASIVNKLKTGFPRAAIAASLVWLAIWLPGVAFGKSAWTNPAELTLPGRDRWEYVTGWPSGYGFREVAAELEAWTTPAQVATLDLGGWQRLTAYLPLDAPVELDYAGPEKIAAGEWPRPLGPPAYLLLDHPKDDLAAADLPLSLEPVAAYPRPGNESRLILYAVIDG